MESENKTKEKGWWTVCMVLYLGISSSTVNNSHLSVN